jgi:hypothetical protein
MCVVIPSSLKDSRFTMQATALEWTEWTINSVMFWEPDEKKRAKIVRAVHHFLSYGLITLIIVAHTIYPAFWLQSALLVVCIMVWIHHLLTGGCIISKLEQKWLGDNESFVDPFLVLFNVKLAEDDDRSGFVTMGSTFAVFFLTLEWLSRASHFAWTVVRAQGPRLVSTLTSGIPPLPSSP